MRSQVGLTFRYEQKASPYELALERVGLNTIRIARDAKQSIDGLSGGLVVTGGTDINPTRYGQVRIAQFVNNRGLEFLIITVETRRLR